LDGVKKAGRNARYVFGVWVGIAVLSGLAAMVGFFLLQNAPAELVAFITAVAAGAILAMLPTRGFPKRSNGTTCSRNARRRRFLGRPNVAQVGGSALADEQTSRSFV
jgi:hypothetical protein